MQNYKFPSNIRLYPRPGLTILTAMNLCFDALSPYPERTGSVVTCIKENKLGRLYASKLISYVGVRRLELPTSTSRTWRAANCATPRAGCCFRKSAAKIANFLQRRAKMLRKISIKQPLDLVDGSGEAENHHVVAGLDACGAGDEHTLVVAYEAGYGHVAAEVEIHHLGTGDF